jgi:hypothetical protein
LTVSGPSGEAHIRLASTDERILLESEEARFVGDTAAILFST